MNGKQLLLVTCVSTCSFIAGCGDESSDLKLEFIDSGRTVGSYEFAQIPDLQQGSTRASIREAMLPAAMLSFLPEDTNLEPVKEYDLVFRDEGSTFEAPVGAPASGDGNYLLEVSWQFDGLTIGRAEYALTYDSTENDEGDVEGFSAEVVEGKVPPSTSDTESYNEDSDFFSNLEELNAGTDPAAGDNPLPANASVDPEIIAGENLVIIQQRTEDGENLTDWGVNTELSINQQDAPGEQLATWSAYHSDGLVMVTVEESADSVVEVEVALNEMMMVLQETTQTDQMNDIFDYSLPTDGLAEGFPITIEIKDDAGATIGIRNYSGILQDSVSSLPGSPVNKPSVQISAEEVRECEELTVVATTLLNEGQTISGVFSITPMDMVALGPELSEIQDGSNVVTVPAQFPSFQAAGVNVYSFVYTATAEDDETNSNDSDAVQVTVLDNPEIESCDPA